MAEDKTVFCEIIYSTSGLMLLTSNVFISTSSSGTGYVKVVRDIPQRFRAILKIPACFRVARTANRIELYSCKQKLVCFRVARIANRTELCSLKQKLVVGPAKDGVMVDLLVILSIKTLVLATSKWSGPQ